MNRLVTILALSVGLGVAFPGLASAHNFAISASCKQGLSVELDHYSGVDDIDVWVDDVHVVDTTFHQTYSLHIDFDKTQPHTWRVKVSAGDEHSPDRHGTTVACVTPPTTTTAPTTTTTTTTTTVPVEVTPTVAQPTTTTTVGPQPTLPATGPIVWPTLAVATCLVILGAIFVSRRRVR